MARKKSEPYVQVEEAEDEDKEGLDHKFDLETVVRFYAKNGRDWIQVEFDDSMIPWYRSDRQSRPKGLSLMLRSNMPMLIDPASSQAVRIVIGR